MERRRGGGEDEGKWRGVERVEVYKKKKSEGGGVCSCLIAK